MSLSGCSGPFVVGTAGGGKRFGLGLDIRLEAAKMSVMRLVRGEAVAGQDPELARELLRACHNRAVDSDVIAHRVGMSAAQVAPMLVSLAEHGFLESEGTGRGDRWHSTIAGGALSMASFNRPISRAKAQQLLVGVLDQAREYNADPGKLHWITTLELFGSYLSEADSLGDVDLAIVIDDRPGTTDRTEALLDYAHASGKSFNTFIDRLFYSRNELLTTLKKRSSYIHIHTEDTSRFTDTSQVIFTR